MRHVQGEFEMAEGKRDAGNSRGLALYGANHIIMIAKNLESGVSVANHHPGGDLPPSSATLNPSRSLAGCHTNASSSTSIDST
jgi:hypothetical protein